MTRALDYAAMVLAIICTGLFPTILVRSMIAESYQLVRYEGEASFIDDTGLTAEDCLHQLAILEGDYMCERQH